MKRSVEAWAGRLVYGIVSLWNAEQHKVWKNSATNCGKSVIGTDSRRVLLLTMLKRRDFIFGPAKSQKFDFASHVPLFNLLRLASLYDSASLLVLFDGD